jgi:glycosyltransferase involved in cell wall biosynthesis
MNRPTVSVVTPTYNRAAFLAETIASIRAQRQLGLQHLIIDDGSTDGTEALVGALVAEAQGVPDYSLEYVRQENRGEAAAVNAGWRRATGRYVAVVNSDDPQPPEWLQGCVVALEDDPAAVVAYPDWCIHDAAGRILHAVTLPPFSEFELIAKARCLPGPGAVIRRALVPDDILRKETLRYTSDYEAWLRLSAYGHFVHVAGVRAAWRQHGEGTSGLASSLWHAEELLSVIEDFFDAPQLPEHIQAWRRLARACAAYQAARMTWRSNFGHAVAYLAQAVPVLLREGQFPWGQVRAAVGRFRAISI